MKDIVDVLTSPLWWFTAIIAGLLVNILAAYTKPFLDRFLSAISKRYRVWSADRKERIGKVSFYLLEHPDEAADLRGQVVHLTLKMVLAIAAGLFFSQGFEFLAGAVEFTWEAYFWLKIVIYFTVTLITIVLFQRYRLLASILKDYDSSIYSAVDRFRKKKYD